MLRVAGAIWPILGFLLLRCNPRDLKNIVLAVAKPRFLKKRAARAKSKQKSIDHKKCVLAVVKSNISQKHTTRAKSQKTTVDLKNRILTIMKTMISKNAPRRLQNKMCFFAFLHPPPETAKLVFLL